MAFNLNLCGIIKLTFCIVPFHLLKDSLQATWLDWDAASRGRERWPWGFFPTMSESEGGAEAPTGSNAPLVDDGGGGSKEEEGHWLLCVVVCLGEGLYVGPKRTCGDIFCMLHTYDGVCRSRTVSQDYPPPLLQPLTFPPLPAHHHLLYCRGWVILGSPCCPWMVTAPPPHIQPHTGRAWKC